MTDVPVFANPAIPLNERIADLLSKLTVEEKIAFMRFNTPAVPRLGIPAYSYWNEALHGVARNGRATVFPQAIGLSATWNPRLIQQIASAIGDEARAKFHYTLAANGGTGTYQGLTFWSPNINIFRDPRWGRGQETWGEDPYLTGELGVAFARGLQGDHPVYLKAAACAKHFAVHSGPEGERHQFNADVPLSDLRQTYLPAFEKLVIEGKVEAVMCAYNAVLGEPCCASQRLLQEILRDEWGFQGHVVSDCGALTDLHSGHRISRDPAESAALALRAGCDLACDSVFDHLGEALRRELITVTEIDQALTRTLAARFKLGLFDPPERVPFASTPLDVVCCREHRELARQAAAQSIVLLKNNGILPLGNDIKRLLVTGPAAASLDVLLGNYYGINSPLVSLLEGIIEAAPAGIGIEYRPGCSWTVANSNPRDWTVTVSGQSNVTLACMGLCPMMEGEEGDAAFAANWGDRDTISLPRHQEEYIRSLANAGGRIVLALTGGSPIALNGLEDVVEAIVFLWYPGQEGGRALADVLFGKISPAGRLPVTFPRTGDQLPPFDHYAMTGRTYRYSMSEPLFPFGFGLSYSRFAYSNLRLSSEHLAADETLEVGVTVTNTGEFTADEVVQVYLIFYGPPRLP